MVSSKFIQPIFHTLQRSHILIDKRFLEGEPFVDQFGENRAELDRWAEGIFRDQGRLVEDRRAERLGELVRRHDGWMVS